MSLKYSVTFLILAASALMITWATDHVAVRGAVISAALAFVLVAVSYAIACPRLLFKNPRGHRRPWAWLLYWPYFLLNALGMSLFRLGERRPPFVEVVPNLFLGRRLTAREVRGGETPSWRSVLDLAAEFPEVIPLRAVYEYRSLPVLDATAPSLDDLSSAVAWLTGRVAEGPVYVHCALGHGRSATLVVAFLLATGRAATVEEGIALVRARRPGVRLVAPQLGVLMCYSRVVAGDCTDPVSTGSTFGL